MANTTKANVLMIAPELGVKINDILQSSIVTVEDVLENTEYRLVINGTEYSIISGAPTSEAEILLALLTEIESIEGIIARITSDGLVIDGTAEFISFELVVSSNLINTLVRASKDNNSLFELILADVILQVTEVDPTRFREEQERAQRYLVAHLLTLLNTDPDAGDLSTPFNKEYVGDVQYHYDSMSLRTADEAFFMRTPYGEVFYEIYKRRYFRFL